jgi:parvulin-like peptidyl-prolyl isomerase
MKKILSLFVVLFSVSVLANLPDIVAIVNDQPITKYDFESRKKMAVVLNNIDVSDPTMDARLNSDILNILIEEELLNQHAEKVGGAVSKADLDNVIATIEQRNNMPKNGMRAYLTEKGLDTESFRKQIKGELIKYNIISSLSQSVSVSQTELDVALINNNDQDFDVEVWVFTSRETGDKALSQMQLLKKRLVSCNKVEDRLYADFADGEKFDRPLKQMPDKTQSVVLDTKIGSSSRVYKEENKFKLVFVCKKDPAISSGDLNKIKSFLSNKKMSQKAAKFFKDLRAKAYIKLMIPG